ncbi:MAG: ABC transporter permease [Bryobacteraceae bacterium]|nr:ABC transporter permease [Bryobacteraceae bacterium]
MVNKLVLENLKHRPIRTLLTVLAIGLQVTLVLTVVGLTRGLVEASATRTRGIGADIMIRPPGSSVLGLTSAPMSEGMVGFAEKQPHVRLAQGVVIHGVGGMDSLTGVDLGRFTKMAGGLDYLSGGPLQQQTDLLIDENYASQRKLRAGDIVELANQKWTVRGVVGAGKLGKLFVDKSYLQQVTSNTGKISMVYLQVDDPKNIQPVIDSLRAQLKEYPIFSIKEFLSQLTPGSIPGVTPFIAVLVGLSVIFGFLIVFLAMYTAVLERTREIGVLKALGATSGYVMGMLLRETIMLAVTGAVIGIVLSFLARWVISVVVPDSLPVVIVPDWWPWSALISIAGAVLGALYPGLKAARQDTIEALAYD